MRSPPGLVVAAALLASDPRSARAYCRTTTTAEQPDPLECPAAGLPIAWPGGCASHSISPGLLPDGITRDDFRAAVTAAEHTWSAAACEGGAVSFHLVAYPDVDEGGAWHPDAPNANTVSFRPTWSDDAFHPREALAVTITTFEPDTGVIVDADTEMNLRTPQNPRGFLFTTGAPDATTADLPTIVLHETGHSQGLAHSSVRTAVMWSRAGLGEQRRTLDRDDVAGLCSIYPAGRTAACDARPRNGFEGDRGCTCTATVGARGKFGTHRSVVPALLVLVLAAARRGRSVRRDAHDLGGGGEAHRAVGIE